MSYSEGAKLIVTRPGRPGREFPLGGRAVLIGREPSCDIVIDSPVVSRQHARVGPQGDDYVLTDVGATNGLFVNGQRIEGAHALKAGDKVQLGEDTLVFVPGMADASETQVVRSTPIPPAGGSRPPAAPRPATPVASEGVSPDQPADLSASPTAPEAQASAPEEEAADSTTVAPPPVQPPQAAAEVSPAPPPPPVPPETEVEATTVTQPQPRPEWAGAGASASAAPPPPPPASPYSQPAAWEAPGAGSGLAAATRLAGFWRRFGSLIIDAVIVSIIEYVLDLILRVPASSFGPSTGVGFIVGVAYFTWGFGSGQTVGCRALNLRIVDQNTNAAPGYAKGLVRYLMSYVSGIVVLLGYLWMLWDSKKQTWHDKVAGTLVLYQAESPVDSVTFNQPS